MAFEILGLDGGCHYIPRRGVPVAGESCFVQTKVFKIPQAVLMTLMLTLWEV